MTISEFVKAELIMRKLETSNANIDKFNKFIDKIPKDEGITLGITCAGIESGSMCILNKHCKDFFLSLRNLLQEQCDDVKQQFMDL